MGRARQRLSKELVSAVKEIDRGKGRRPSTYWGKSRSDEVLAGLARSLIVTGQDELLSDVTAHALADPKTYPLREAHVPAIVGLKPWLKTNLKRPCPPLTHWIAWCRKQLESLTAAKPEEPSDFRREADHLQVLRSAPS